MSIRWLALTAVCLLLPTSPRAQESEAARPAPPVLIHFGDWAGTLVRSQATQQGDEVHVPVAIDAAIVDRLQLAVAGESEEEAAKRVQVDERAVVLNLARAKPAFLRPKEKEDLKLSGEKTYLGGRMLYSEGDAGRVESWRLFLRTRHDPVTWRDADRAYATQVVVGVEEEESTGRSRRLPEPVTIQFFPQGADVDVTPASVTVDASGTSGYAEARLVARKHTITPRVLAEGSFGSQDWSFAVQPALARLDLQATQMRIPGFGLGTTELTVRRRAEDGLELAGVEALPVLFRTQRGVMASRITIDPERSDASVTLRSAGVGRVEVVASAGLVETQVDVVFTWPLLLLAISLVMGALGGWVRVVRARRAGAPALPSRTRVLMQLSVGAFTGVIAVAGAATGLAALNVPPAVAATEAGAAVVSGLGGYSGIWLLSRLARTLGMQPDPGEAE